MRKIEFKAPDVPIDQRQGRRDAEHRRVIQMTEHNISGLDNYLDAVVKSFQDYIAGGATGTWTPPNKELIIREIGG